MQASRSVSDAEQQQQLLAEGSEAADFISSSIVQAVANDRGSYGAFACQAAGPCSSGPSPLLQWLGMPCCPQRSACRERHSWQATCWLLAAPLPASPTPPHQQPVPALLPPPAAEMTIVGEHLGGLVEEVTPDMKLPRERKTK